MARDGTAPITAQHGTLSSEMAVLELTSRQLTCTMCCVRFAPFCTMHTPLSCGMQQTVHLQTAHYDGLTRRPSASSVTSTSTEPAVCAYTSTERCCSPTPPPCLSLLPGASSSSHQHNLTHHRKMLPHHLLLPPLRSANLQHLPPASCQPPDLSPCHLAAAPHSSSPTRPPLRPATLPPSPTLRPPPTLPPSALPPCHASPLGAHPGPPGSAPPPCGTRQPPHLQSVAAHVQVLQPASLVHQQPVLPCL
jgi:hypothetical protein